MVLADPIGAAAPVAKKARPAAAKRNVRPPAPEDCSQTEYCVCAVCGEYGTVVQSISKIRKEVK